MLRGQQLSVFCKACLGSCRLEGCHLFGRAICNNQTINPEIQRQRARIFGRYVEEQQRFTDVLLAQCDVLGPPDCNYNLCCLACVCLGSIDKTHICHWRVADGSASV